MIETNLASSNEFHACLLHNSKLKTLVVMGTLALAERQTMAGGNSKQCVEIKFIGEQSCHLQ